MATHQGVLLLFSGLEHGCCLPQDPPQPPPVSSMLASQTSSPGYKGEEEGGRAHPSMVINGSIQCCNYNINNASANSQIPNHLPNTANKKC